MKERPILFSGAMVRALLAGTKTQTRRILKTQPSDGWALDNLGTITSKHAKQGRFGAFLRRGVGTDFPQLDLLPCPYGAPGDRLYVRESWNFEKNAIGSVRDEDGPFEYAADGLKSMTVDDRWRPSIHMPRYASRILLEIVGVRVERLIDCSVADAIEEGVFTWWSETEQCASGHPAPPVIYRNLWESINGVGSWAANPWVWVVEFKRVSDANNAGNLPNNRPAGSYSGKKLPDTEEVGQ